MDGHIPRIIRSKIDFFRISNISVMRSHAMCISFFTLSLTLSMWLADPSRDLKTFLICGSRTPSENMYSYSLPNAGNSSTDNPMCVNCHQFVLWSIQITFCNPWPCLAWGHFRGSYSVKRSDVTL